MAWERIKRLVTRKKDMPSGLWMKCNACGNMVYKRKVEEQHKVCPECDNHFALTSQERLRLIADADSFEELWQDIESVDSLEFQVKNVSYDDKLVATQKKTGLKEACRTGRATIYGRLVAMALMDFSFLGASMGSVVGEKITRLAEIACQERIPLIVVSCSGGARMHEGALSLMQMAKVSAALASLHDNDGLYISLLTNPTTGGVSASFASQGDIILAEPGALIGFAGPRVIEETINQKLPEGFQTSEFLLEHGFIDRIVQRAELRRELVKILGYLGDDFDKGVVEEFERNDHEVHEAWIKAHETQRIDKSKEAPAINGGNRREEVDNEMLDPSSGKDGIDIVET
ncbi:acetyl-CoA carboxylase, carboxyltransferase subunit beta [Planctomycetota bacterium]